MDLVTTELDAEEGQGWSWKTGSPEKRERMEAFIDWCLTPPHLRQPTSKAKLAEKLGVSPQTLRNYQQDPTFQRQMGDRARSLVRVDRLPDILESLYDQAIDRENTRSVQASKLLLDFAKETVEVSESIDVESMSTDALVKVALELLHKVNGESASS